MDLDLGHLDLDLDSLDLDRSTHSERQMMETLTWWGVGAPPLILPSTRDSVFITISHIWEMVPSGLVDIGSTGLVDIGSTGGLAIVL